MLKFDNKALGLLLTIKKKHGNVSVRQGILAVFPAFFKN